MKVKNKNLHLRRIMVKYNMHSSWKGLYRQIFKMMLLKDYNNILDNNTFNNQSSSDALMAFSFHSSNWTSNRCMWHMMYCTWFCCTLQYCVVIQTGTCILEMGRDCAQCTHSWGLNLQSIRCFSIASMIINSVQPDSAYGQGTKPNRQWLRWSCTKRKAYSSLYFLHKQQQIPIITFLQKPVGSNYSHAKSFYHPRRPHLTKGENTKEAQQI